MAITSRGVVLVIGLVVLLALPQVAVALDEPFYVDLFARIMIFAIAAMSLDLILGFGGMVSFGHAAYLGVGAYAVGVLSFYGIDNGVLQLLVAIVASALVSLGIGAISLRTTGVYFIMITLAFTQMLYFFGISLETYGGDDGMPTNRSEFFGAIDLYTGNSLYYLILGILLLFLFLGRRLVSSRFGMVIRGARSNERRMRALGFPIYRYKLAAFVLAGTMCGVAGALLANLTEFVTPEFMHWTRSGELLIMVIMGGIGTLFGPVLGATAFLLLEEYLPEMMNAVIADTGVHWQIVLGPILIFLVLFARRGILGILPSGRAP